MYDNVILPVFTGIISGIISSIIVTQFYRIRDRERDRVKYFKELYDFFQEFNGRLTFVRFPDEVLKLSEIEMPKLYKWIHVSRRERAVIKRIDRIYHAVEGIVSKISCRVFEIKLFGGDMEDVIKGKHEIHRKYVNDLEKYQEEFDKLRDDVYYFKHPEEKINKLLDVIDEFLDR